MRKIFKHYKGPGKGVVKVEAKLSDIIMAVQSEEKFKDSDVWNFLDSKLARASSHFTKHKCPGKLSKPNQDESGEGTGEDTGEGKNGSEDYCWHYRDTIHGIDGNGDYRLYYDLDFGGDGGTLGGVDFEANAKLRRWLRIQVMTYLGTSSPRRIKPQYDEKGKLVEKGRWEFDEETADQVYVSPACKLNPPDQQGRKALNGILQSADRCGMDVVTGTLRVLYVVQKVTTVRTKVKVDSLTNNANLKLNWNSVEEFSGTLHIDFEHTPDTSREMAATKIEST